MHTEMVMASTVQPTRARQHDAHVRARRALVTRVLARWYDWSPTAFHGKQWRALPFEERERRIIEAIGAAISVYKWRSGWGDKYSRYHTFGAPQRVIGQYADVPADVVHSIMCSAIGHLKESRAGGVP